MFSLLTFQLWAGSPAKFVKAVDEDAAEGIKNSAEAYTELQAFHSEEFLPFGTQHRDL